MMKPKDILDTYYNLLKGYKTPFPCPTCSVLVLARNYEKHAKVCSNLDPVTHCVWCKGLKSWKKGTKSQNVEHLRNCFKLCTFRIPPPPPAEPRFSYTPDVPIQELYPDFESFFSGPEQTFVLDNTEILLCPEKDFFDQDKLPNLPDLAYKPFAIRKLKMENLPVSFQNKNLNLAAACVRLFFELRDTHQFFHCIVRVIVMPQFIELLLEDQNHSFMLPFYCYCNGGDWEEKRIRHHRHMIVGSPKEHFDQHVWKKIKIRPEDKPLNKKGQPIKNFRSLHKVLIKQPMHFVNVIGYLSKRESRCTGSLDEKKQSKTQNLNHFYIYKSLPVHFRLYLTALWDGGLLELIRQTHRHLAPKHMHRVARFIDGRWRIPIRDIHNIELHQVLAVAKHFKPSREPTDHYLHLLNGRKLYFQRDDALLALESNEAWGRVQAEGGNMFYGAIERELWTPGKFQQQCLNAIDEFKLERPSLLEIECDRLLLENRFLKDNAETQRDQFTCHVVTLKKEMEEDRVKRELETQCQVADLKRELEFRNAENERLKRELETQCQVADLKRELESRIAENERLKRELETQCQVADLKRELESRNAENEILKRELETQCHVADLKRELEFRIAENERLKRELESRNAENEQLKRERTQGRNPKKRRI